MKTFINLSIACSVLFLVPAEAQQTRSKPSFLNFLRKDKVDACKAMDDLEALEKSGGKVVNGDCCVGEDYPTRATIVKNAGTILNQLERHIEEWGHASFSEVVLIPDFKGESFSIDNPHNYRYYEKHTRLSSQGHARVTQQIVSSVGATGAISTPGETIDLNSLATQVNNNVNVGYTPTEKRLADELKELKAKITKLENQPVKENPAKTDTPYTGVAIPESDIQALASSTTVTGKVLNFMSNPVGISENQHAYIGLSQVSVSPGWRTQRDYYCEVQVAVEYARDNDEGGFELSLTDSESLLSGKVPIPSVFAAFPLAQSQILDLNYSSDTMNTMMLSVAAQVATTNPLKGAMFLRRMKRVTQDLDTKNALPVVVPSSDGKSLTYRFQPSVHALSNPTNKRSDPGWRLNPVSIPALLVVICDKDTLRDWDHISFTYSTRWVPLKTNAGLTGAIFDRLDRPVFPDRRLSNRKRLHNATGIDYLVCSYFWMLENPGFLPLEMRSRVVNLRNLIRSHRNTSGIPAPAPIIDRVTPDCLSLEELCSSGLCVSGKNFLGFEGIGECKQGDVTLTIAGVPMEIGEISSNHMIARVNPENINYLREHAVISPGTLQLPVRYKNTFGTCNCSPSITIQADKAPALASGITAFHPKAVNPESAVTVVITGYGFEDANGTDTLIKALIGSVAADKINVVNSKTAVLSFTNLEGPLREEPLIVVGSSGVLNYTDSDKKNIPKIKIVGEN